MAFKKKRRDNRKIQMVSLIDLIFILLLFFIITSVMIRLSKGESKLYIPTPKNEPGEAQILIQIIDQDTYLWLDHTAIDTLNRYRHLLGKANETAPKIDLLVDKMTVSSDLLFSRLMNLRDSSRDLRNKEYFVLIRCPNELPYYLATNIIEKMIDNPYLEYGCVAGSLSDIRSSKKIIAKDNVFQIDF